MEERCLYVAENGNDAWSGTHAEPTATGDDGPFASLERAREAVQELVAEGLSQPVTVYIREGTCHLGETLELDATVSGVAACPVTFAAYAGERAVVSGGRPVTGWRREKDNLWTADAGGTGRVSRTLRVGDTQAVRARYPSYDPADPIKGGWLFADWWGKPWELGRFHIPIDTATKPGDRVEWKVTAPVTGEYTVWMHHIKTDPSPVQSSLGVRGGAHAQLTDLDETGSWHEYRYVRLGTIRLEEGEQTLVWENTSGGEIALDAIALCTDPDWHPAEKIRITGWHTREYEVDAPAPGNHFLLIQAEAWSALSEGVVPPRPPDRRFPGSEPPGLRDRIHVRPGDLPDWDDWEGAEIHIFAAWGWSNRIVSVKHVDREKGIIFADFNDDIRPGNRYFISSARAALTDPGEWLFDRANGRLSYLAPEGVSEVKEAVAARLKTAIRVSGDHIHLRDLVIADTDYTGPDEAPDIGGAGAEDGAIEFSQAAHSSVTGCRFECVNGWGIRLLNRSHHILIAHNEMKDLGQGGVELFGDDETQPFENTIVANDIENCGRVYAHVAGVYANASSRNRIAHNRIYRMPRYAISLKSPGNRASHHNVVEYNDIRDTNQETSDTGAIEVYGGGKKNTGNILRYNRIINAIGCKMSHLGEFMTPFYSWGIYLDDWASDVTVFGNLIVGNVCGGVNMHGGWDNLIENNIMVNGADRQISLSPIFSDITSDTLRDNVVRRNVVAYTKTDALFIWCRPNRWYPEILKECDHNLYWCMADFDIESPDLDYLMPVGNLQAWRETGFDRNTIVADPCFTDPDHGDFTLRDDSPAYGMGFQRIPVEKIGPKGYS